MFATAQSRTCTPAIDLILLRRGYYNVLRRIFEVLSYAMLHYNKRHGEMDYTKTAPGVMSSGPMPIYITSTLMFDLGRVKGVHLFVLSWIYVGFI